MDALAEIVRSRRKELGLTLAVVARRCGFTESYLSKIERGTRRPAIPLAKRLDEVLDTGDLIQRALTGEHDVITPAQLPPVPILYGREKLFEQLSDLREMAPLITLEGPAGVGKTALAAAWAWRNTATYPDAVLYVDLHGSTPQHPAVNPFDVLGDLLSDLGVPALPSTLDARARLLRSLAHTRRLLLILDDAASTIDIAPLLCGSPTSTVLITSRRSLTNLRVHEASARLRVPALNSDNAVRMLVDLTATDLQTDRALLAAIARDGCDGLPVAVRAAAAIITDHPQHDLATLAAQLTGPDRLSLLDRVCGLRNALQLATSRLDRPALDVLHALSTSEHDSTTAADIAERVGLSAARTDTALVTLTGEHLVLAEPRGYRCPRLVRTYARSLAAVADAA